MVVINPNIEAEYYHKDGDKYVCDLCPHECHICTDQLGKCNARKGVEDKLIAYTYGKVSSICVDPIEKKPLYHYHPKSKIFSVGGIGCNMACKHCQNHTISISPIGKRRTTYESPEELIALCEMEKMTAVAFTYNEPIIWIEYIQDFVKYAPHLKCVIVSNGLINEEPLRALCKITDAMNIDVKGFTDKFYVDICGSHLKDVLKSAKIIFEEGVHLELTYLVIPGHNDSETEIEQFSIWVKNELSSDVPIHFLRFHPDNLMEDVPITPLDTVLSAREIAISNGLNYVYVGNALTEGASDTYCPECGAVVIKRTGYSIEIIGLDGNRCAYCKHNLNIIQ